VPPNWDTLTQKNAPPPPSNRDFQTGGEKPKQMKRFQKKGGKDLPIRVKTPKRGGLVNVYFEKGKWGGQGFETTKKVMHLRREERGHKRPKRENTLERKTGRTG